MRKNVVLPAPVTHEGARAKRINPEEQLRRTLMACLLWEDEFYEDGESVAARLQSLALQVPFARVAEMAVEARTKQYLRHAPLLLAKALLSRKIEEPLGKNLAQQLVENVIHRPDEAGEFLALFGRKVPRFVRRGIAAALAKFDEYQLAKWDGGKAAFKLRDVIRLCHPKPTELFGKIIRGELATPATWETELSAGKDKKDTWTRLLSENKLGGLALLRNLRNMQQVKVEEKVIVDAIGRNKFNFVLPFRFIAAARHAPNLEPALELAMLRKIRENRTIPGRTVVLVDVSGSMCNPLSSKSDMTRMDAACGVAVLLREICESVGVVSFSDKAIEIPPRHGFALRDAIVQSQSHSGTYLGMAIAAVPSGYDRLVVITDEQSHDEVPDRRGFTVNVASAKNGVGYRGGWTHVDGFSESVVKYVTEVVWAEKQNQTAQNQSQSGSVLG